MQFSWLGDSTRHERLKMKLSELRANLKTAGAFDLWTLGATSARELVTDIDQEIKKAYANGYQGGCGHTNVPSADGWDYRKAVRTGWNGAINRVRARVENELERCSEVRAVLTILDETASANDVPEMNTGERKMAEARAERMPEDAFRSGAVRVTAPADSELGIELSKIRDRLNKLETQVPPMHPSVRDRLDALENGAKRHDEHAKWHEVTKFGERIGLLEAWRIRVTQR